jgi:spermidine synthase
MSMLLERREDSSLAFFLDGDLQFDSVDEHIYHEGLALPALMIAESRGKNALRALIIGGGDGLTARELLKSQRLEKIDLVDYDSEVLQLARTKFAELNRNSLEDNRLAVTVEDARIFVKRALDAGIQYDVIVSDLTSPDNVEGAQLHSIEFYQQLSSLLTENGCLAVNTASPSGTPEAYWSIYNSILASKLNPRAYRIVLPSFAEQSYGADWGLIVASRRLIDASEIGGLEFAQSNRFLTGAAVLRDLFTLPAAVMARQATVAAGSGTSDVLVHYLRNSVAITADDAQPVDTLSLDLATLAAPAIETKSFLLPIELRQALVEWKPEPGQEEQITQQIFELMPALNRHQTREMVNDFLNKPAAFLQAINLGELVNELLRRAKELPVLLRDELVILRDKLADYAQDKEELLGLGLRSLAVVALVVIIGNLMYPDAVYAKGRHGGYGVNSWNGGYGGVYNPYPNGKRVINENVNVTTPGQRKPPAHAVIDNVSPAPGQ